MGSPVNVTFVWICVVDPIESVLVSVMSVTRDCHMRAIVNIDIECYSRHEVMFSRSGVRVAFERSGRQQ